MFRDEAVIEVIAGRGGDGLASFRREKYVPMGGPDGGDGGHGGSVILEATFRETSLLRIGRERRYAAPNGQPGGPRKCTGKTGETRIIEVPVGTQVFDDEHGQLLDDLAKEGQQLEVVRGGRGGKGNQHFANSVRQAPRHAQKGKEGERRRVRLELKLFAEVGLVGLPNAGKSTFLSRVTSATPKIADYPFTTLEPQVGIAKVHDYQTLVVADLPGLIEGAAEGHGLGHRFLRHVERCKVLLHLVDCTATADPEPLEAMRVIEAELAAFSPVLAAKPRLLVASKVEDDESRARAQELAQGAGQPVLTISSATGDGLAELLSKAHDLVHGVESGDW